MPQRKSSQDQKKLDGSATANGSAPSTPGLEQRIDEARLRKLAAQARVAEAKAEEAEHAAAAEPKRQNMKLKERSTRLRLEETKVKVALVAILILLVIQGVAVLINPLISPLSVLAVCLGLVGDQLRRRASGSGDHDPDP